MSGNSCIIAAMNIIPEHIVTQMELRRGTGERGTRKLIAYNNIVYDVTDCPKWRTDLHECRRVALCPDVCRPYGR